MWLFLSPSPILFQGISKNVAAMMRQWLTVPWIQTFWLCPTGHFINFCFKKKALKKKRTWDKLRCVFANCYFVAFYHFIFLMTVLYHAFYLWNYIVCYISILPSFVYIFKIVFFCWLICLLPLFWIKSLRWEVMWTLWSFFWIPSIQASSLRHSVTVISTIFIPVCRLLF